MAKSLNKNRMMGSKIALLITLTVVITTRQFFADESLYHEAFELLGNFMVAICAMGRVYSTAFLGGFKNNKLVDHGVYSIIRNPLYFFSLIGIAGVALISNHLVVMLGLPLFFILLYSRLIAREEGYLLEQFGQDYIDYKKRVPALWPRFSQYRAPETTQMYPKFLNKAFLDAVWWLSALPFIEAVEYLQDLNIYRTFFAT